MSVKIRSDIHLSVMKHFPRTVGKPRYGSNDPEYAKVEGGTTLFPKSLG